MGLYDSLFTVGMQAAESYSHGAPGIHHLNLLPSKVIRSYFLWEFLNQMMHTGFHLPCKKLRHPGKKTRVTFLGQQCIQLYGDRQGSTSFGEWLYFPEVVRNIVYQSVIWHMRKGRGDQRKLSDGCVLDVLTDTGRNITMREEDRMMLPTLLLKGSTTFCPATCDLNPESVKKDKNFTDILLVATIIPNSTPGIIVCPKAQCSMKRYG